MAVTIDEGQIYKARDQASRYNWIFGTSIQFYFNLSIGRCANPRCNYSVKLPLVVLLHYGRDHQPVVNSMGFWVILSSCHFVIFFSPFLQRLATTIPPFTTFFRDVLPIALLRFARNQTRLPINPSYSRLVGGLDRNAAKQLMVLLR